MSNIFEQRYMDTRHIEEIVGLAGIDIYSAGENDRPKSYGYYDEDAEQEPLTFLQNVAEWCGAEVSDFCLWSKGDFDEDKYMFRLAAVRLDGGSTWRIVYQCMVDAKNLNSYVRLGACIYENKFKLGRRKKKESVKEKRWPVGSKKILDGWTLLPCAVWLDVDRLSPLYIKRHVSFVDAYLDVARTPIAIHKTHAQEREKLIAARSFSA